MDEFLAWAEGREGRYELEDGHVVTLSAERLAHATVKVTTSSSRCGTPSAGPTFPAGR